MESSTENDELDQIIQDAFEKRQSNLYVQGRGTVVELLPDDLTGSRHQRILVRLASGLTLLITHNIDMAPRVHTLKHRDALEFVGEYEWNPKGGLIHWTHHAPDAHHPNGWLKHNDKIYQ